MKILVITNNPERASFRQRIGVFLRDLVYDGIGCEVVKYPAGLLGRWKVLRSTSDYDAVFLHKRRLNPIDAFIIKGLPKRLLYDFDDAIMYDDKIPEKSSGKRQKDFARTVKMADTVIAGNPFLAEHAKKYNSNVKVLATGLDLKPFEVQRERDDEKIRLVWIGSKSTIKYLKGIKDALEEIGKRHSNVVLRIICDDFFDLDNMPVEKLQWSLETQCSDLVNSDIGLAPLPDNNFTRGKCGFKILQYAAAGLATIASPVGVNAEYVVKGDTGLHANDTEQWIESIEMLVKDAEIRNSMGEKAKLMVRGYDIPVIQKNLSKIIKDTIEN